jgi:hypothetical protein
MITRYVWPFGPNLWQHLKAAHPRHINVGQDQNKRLLIRIGDARKRKAGR